MVSLKGIDPAPSGAGPGSGSHERSSAIVVRHNNKWASHVWRWAVFVGEVEAATTKNAGVEANKVSPLRSTADFVVPRRPLRALSCETARSARTTFSYPCARAGCA